MGRSTTLVHFVHNLAVKKDDPPVGDKDVDAIGAMLSQHLVFKVLNPKHLFTLCSRIHSCQGIHQGAFSHILNESKSVSDFNNGRSE